MPRDHRIKSDLGARTPRDPSMSARFSPKWLESHRVHLPTIDADEIIGIGHVMKELASLLARLRQPEVARSLNLELPRGLLLWGEPGVGKTLVARYLATQLGTDIPFYELGSDELTPDRLRGGVRWLSERYPRSVLFIDEIDSWGLHRDAESHSPETRLVLAAALASLDGLVPSSGLIVVASSNRSPRALDPALIRAGRLGFHIRFDLPDEPERAALLRLFIGARPSAGSIDFVRAARLSRGRTPADLRAMVDDGFGIALAADRQAIADVDLVDAIRRAGEVVPEDDDPDPGLRHRLAIHEAGHTAVAVALRGVSWVYSVAIRSADGKTSCGSEKIPRHWQSEDELLDMIVVVMGGIAAERLILEGGPSLGGTDDIERATTFALERIDAGLDESLPPMAFDQLGQRAPESLRRDQGRAVSRLLESARERATRIVSANLAGIEGFAAILEMASELVGDDLRRALVGRFVDEDGSPVGEGWHVSEA